MKRYINPLTRQIPRSVFEALAGNNGLTVGAGISNGGTLTINNSSITDNVLQYQGTGAGIASSGTLFISNSIIRGNGSGKGQTDGGGIYSSGTLEITNSTIDGNSVGGSGGGIFNLGAAIITSSTISGNSSGGGYPGPQTGPGFGGGISSNGTSATLTISNSTISGNSALTIDQAPGRGGGIGNSGSLQIATLAKTFMMGTNPDNLSSDGGGLFERSRRPPTRTRFWAALQNQRRLKPTAVPRPARRVQTPPSNAGGDRVVNGRDRLVESTVKPPKPP